MLPASQIELRPAEAQTAEVVDLRDESGGVDLVGEADARGAVDDLAGDGYGGEVLPDELEHEQLVEVGVEQRADDGVELPVVVVGALGEVDIHASIVVGMRQRDNRGIFMMGAIGSE